MKKWKYGELKMDRLEYECLRYKKTGIKTFYFWIHLSLFNKRENTLSELRCEKELLRRGFIAEIENVTDITSLGYDAIDQYERDKIESKRYTLDKIAVTISIISVLTSILAVCLSIVSIAY